jgi:hypothetical protein
MTQSFSSSLSTAEADTHVLGASSLDAMEIMMKAATMAALWVAQARKFMAMSSTFASSVVLLVVKPTSAQMATSPKATSPL